MQDITASDLPPAAVLFAGVAGVLVLASAVGAVLKWRVAQGAPHGVIDNLNLRIKAWWWMVAVIGVAFAFGTPGVILLFAALSFAGLREFVTVACTGRGSQAMLAACFFVALPLQYLLVADGAVLAFTVALPLGAFMLLPMLAAAGGRTERYLERVAKLQWGLLACVWGVSHVPALLSLQRTAFPPGQGLLLIGFFAIVVQGCDVLQYIWGKLLGRHAVAPVLSPSKTWEGLLGGIASATALGALLHGITPFTPLQAAGLAFIVCVLGFVSGLVMSAIKREHGVKDWGHAIEGHGGMLDRLDSVVFAAPVFFHLVRWSFAG